MSYRPLTADELGLFAAIAVHNGWIRADDALLMAERISVENMSACLLFESHMEPVNYQEIRTTFLIYLNEKTFTTCDGRFGPFIENMINPDYANPHSVNIWNEIQEIENRVMSFWRIRESAKVRAAENAVAFDGLPELPKLSKEEILAKAGDNNRYVYATFKVDESDSMTDYFGGRTARTVIIGFFKSKRESFKSMRKIAASFPPTADYGPGFDDYSAYLVWSKNYDDNPEDYFIEFGDMDEKPRGGCAVPFGWYRDEVDTPHHSLRAFKFDSKSDLESFLEKHAPLKGTEWEVRCDSIEHRENYSMGTGNYLGRSRYSGWVVKSEDISYLRSEPMEYFDPIQHNVSAVHSEPTFSEIYSANV